MVTIADLRFGKIFYLSMGEVKINSNVIDGKVSATLCGQQYCDSIEDLISFINTHEVWGYGIKDTLTGKYFSDYHYDHFTDNRDIIKVFGSEENAADFVELIDNGDIKAIDYDVDCEVCFIYKNPEE